MEVRGGVVKCKQQNKTNSITLNPLIVPQREKVEHVESANIFTTLFALKKSITSAVKKIWYRCKKRWCVFECVLECVHENEREREASSSFFIIQSQFLNLFFYEY